MPVPEVADSFTGSVNRLTLGGGQRSPVTVGGARNVVYGGAPSDAGQKPLIAMAALAICLGWGGRLPQAHALGDGRYEYAAGQGLIGHLAEARPRWTVSRQMENPSAGYVPGLFRSGEERGFRRVATVIGTSALLAGALTAWLLYGIRLPAPARTRQALVQGSVACMDRTGRIRNYVLALTTRGALMVGVFVWIW